MQLVRMRERIILPQETKYFRNVVLLKEVNERILGELLYIVVRWKEDQRVK